MLVDQRAGNGQLGMGLDHEVLNQKPVKLGVLSGRLEVWGGVVVFGRGLNRSGRS